MTNKTWKASKLHDLEILYGTSYKNYLATLDTCTPDDKRRIFVNTYDRIIEAINSLPDEPVTYVKIAMWHAINADKAALNAIQAQFND